MPLTRFGTCPWCERHKQTLFFTVGTDDGELWFEYVCARCLAVCRGIVEEKIKKNGC